MTFYLLDLLILLIVIYNIIVLTSPSFKKYFSFFLKNISNPINKLGLLKIHAVENSIITQIKEHKTLQDFLLIFKESTKEFWQIRKIHISGSFIRNVIFKKYKGYTEGIRPHNDIDFLIEFREWKEFNQNQFSHFLTQFKDFLESKNQSLRSVSMIVSIENSMLKISFNGLKIDVIFALSEIKDPYFGTNEMILHAEIPRFFVRNFQTSFDWFYFDLDESRFIDCGILYSLDNYELKINSCNSIEAFCRAMHFADILWQNTKYGSMHNTKAMQNIAFRQFLNTGISYFDILDKQKPYKYIPSEEEFINCLALNTGKTT